MTLRRHTLSLRALRRPALALVLGALSLTAWSPLAQAQDDGESDAERRKRIARLGSGKIKLPEPTGTVYDLDALVERAMTSNPQLVAREYGEYYNELRQKEAGWAYFPRIEVNSTLSVVPDNTDFNAVSGNIERFLALDIGPLSNTSLRVIFPVYSFKIAPARELAAIGVEEGKVVTRKKRLELITQLREAYYSFQLGKMIMAVSQDGSMLIKEEIERMEEAREFGDGDVDIEDLRKLQLYDAELDAKSIDNERLIRLTKGALGVLAQLQPNAFDVPNFNEDIDTEAFPTLETCLALTRKHQPDLKRLDYGVAAREQQVELAEAQFYPDFFFAFDFGYSFSTVTSPNQTGFVTDPDEIDPNTGEPTQLPFELEPLFNPFNFRRFSFALGLRLQLDPASRYWRLKQAQAQRDETNSLRRAARQGMDLKIEKMWVEAHDHLRKVAVLERRLKTAERWRNQVGIAYQSGGANLQDFLKPLQAYFEARLKLLQAQYDYKVAVAKLGKEIGVIDLIRVAKETTGQPAPKR